MKEPENIQIVQEETAHSDQNGAGNRIAWMRFYEVTGNVRFVCDTYGISKKTFYKWLKRYRESGGDEKSLDDRSKRPHRFPNSTPEQVVQLLRQARNRTGFGQRRLRAYMAKHYNIRISERTIWKILKRGRSGISAGE